MTPQEVLKKYWGYDSFRNLQLDIIESVLAGRDTLGLMPTGGGKSITFQVPAMILDGLTIVVTPLISLMKDQVDNLKSRGIRAATLYSGMTRAERNLAFDRARLGKLKLLYVSPERLRSDSFQTEMRSWNVSLIVVDEAHCISQWGYDFRPSYLRIASLRRQFANVPVLALTASATPVVRADIIASLEFRPGYAQFTLSFHRDNLSYVVRYEHDKEGKLIDSLNAVRGCAIVYVRSRKSTALYADALVAAGISATFYHAGLDPDVKAERQQLWKDDKVRVMVATNAFGMGIDKPDVRVVVHLDVPPSLEEYYQEAGRAGRDGKRSYALLLASPRDKAKLTKMFNAAFPPKDFILKVYEKACVFMDIPVGEGYGHVYEFDPVRFCRTFNLDPDTVRGAIAILNNAGYFDYSDDPTTRARVYIMIRRDEFYHIALEDDEQRVINALLRLYPGLFADYVYIYEDAIAVSLGMSRETVYQTLLALSRKKILHYIPKRVLPYIYMPTSREETTHVVIPTAVYENRRELMKERIDAVRRFTFESDRCRDRVLLEYFGETHTTDCGMCDVCVARRKALEASEGHRPVLNEIASRLIELVEQSPGVELAALLKSATRLAPEPVLIEALRKAVENRKVERRGSRFYPCLT